MTRTAIAIGLAFFIVSTLIIKFAKKSKSGPME